MASLADERAASLISQLELHSVSLLSTSTSSSFHSASATGQDAQRAGKVAGALRMLKVHSTGRPATPIALHQALQQVNDEVYHADDEQGRALTWFANAQLAIECYRTVLQSLFEDAARLTDAIEYWRGIETRALSSGNYLVQTFPERAIRVLGTLTERMRSIANSATQPSSFISTVRIALPPSLLITTIFPHLSARHRAADRSTSERSLLFLTFSPLMLTRQEARLKRRKLETALSDIEQRIGLLAGLTPPSLPAEILEAPSELNNVMGNFVEALGASLSSSPGIASPIELRSPTDLGLVLRYTILGSLPEHQDRLKTLEAEHGPPSRFVRAWPLLVLGPLVAYTVVNRVYNAREAIRAYILAAEETVRGFVVDWVVEPCIKILETVRHGDDTLAIMGKESLKSDLDSLERMVADFGRDQKNYSEAQVAEMAAKVREGDLTPVYRVWEADIKTPVRSAVTGSLIRTLLIQVQKVKVDVALAMDGIEKMLRSQQLTFAFVGVAPSLLVVFALERLLTALVPGRAGGGVGPKAARRRAWTTMRNVDLLVHPEANFSPETPEGQAELGRLLVQAAALRSYARKGGDGGPLSRDAVLRGEFLDDVRALEVDQRKGGRRRAAKRLWKSWAVPLGWNRI